MKPLPQLTNVLIGPLRDENTRSEVKCFSGAQLVRMLNKRLDESNGIFYFATTNFEITWSPEDFLRYMELVEKGYKITVIGILDLTEDFWH